VIRGDFVVNIRISALCIFAAGAIAAGPASAEILHFEAVIDGVCSGTGSSAIGSGTFQLNTATNEFTYEITYSGLASPETFAHIHKATEGSACPPFTANPVVVPLPLGSPKTGTVTYGAVRQADLMAGLHYVNIHNNSFQSGEITGVITLVTQVPFGSAWSATVLVALLCGAGVAVRRMRATV
jgi:hypothetical protein